MTMKEFLQGRRQMLDLHIRQSGGNVSLFKGQSDKDEERELWICNNEYLYSLAQDCNVEGI